jgi:hypothetical protein
MRNKRLSLQKHGDVNSRARAPFRQRNEDIVVSVPVELAQGLFLAVVLPGDVADAPVVAGLDQVEHDHGRRIAVAEFHRGGCGVVDRIGGGDIEGGDVPILSIDERIAVEVGHVVPTRRVLLVLDHQRRERRLEIAPDIGLGVEANAFGILAFVGCVDRRDEGGSPRVGGEGRPSDGHADGAEDYGASRQHRTLCRLAGRPGSRAVGLGAGRGLALLHAKGHVKRRRPARRSVAQWLEHRSPKPGVGGSSPSTPARSVAAKGLALKAWRGKRTLVAA